MSLFSKKTQISRQEFRKVLKESDEYTQLGSQDRLKIEREALPGKKYGQSISKGDLKRAVYNLQKERFQAKDYRQKLKIDRQIKFLRKLGGP